MIRFVLVILTAWFYVVFTHDTTCTLTSIKKITPSIADFKCIRPNGKADNDSLVLKSCGPPGSPPIHSSCTPRIVRSRTKQIQIIGTAMLNADVEGGIADLSISVYPNTPPLEFAGSFDCSIFPDGMPCPFPLKKNDWVSVGGICQPKTNLPVGTFKAKISILNYQKEMVLCLEGSGHIYQ